MRKAKVEPSFEHYLGFLSDGQPLVIVLKGHLVIESLLVEVIQLRRPGNRAWKMNFPDKVSTCVAEGLLPSANAPFYLRLNDIRNDFAHVLGHKLTYDDAFALVKDMAAAGYDFSDDTIHTDRTLSEEWYGLEGCIIEAIDDLYFELAWILHDNGGPHRLG